MNTIGIGKVVVDNTKPGWNYPHFHVILFKENGDNSFYAYCMELGIDAFSEDSAKAAFSEIAANVLDDINQYANEDSLFKCLLDIARSDHNDVFWKEYRIAETELAQYGEDLGIHFERNGRAAVTNQGFLSIKPTPPPIEQQHDAAHQ